MAVALRPLLAPDFQDAGTSVGVVADGDAALAGATAEKLARASEIAAGPGEGPVLLLDHSDNVMSGGTCNTMDIMQAALEAGMRSSRASSRCRWY